MHVVCLKRALLCFVAVLSFPTYSSRVFLVILSSIEEKFHNKFRCNSKGVADGRCIVDLQVAVQLVLLHVFDNQKVTYLRRQF